ncbi:hypothetical protein C2G38_1005999 [Gigaspora rosea]|uniref:Uncharacterized protein n=1 Tax=Gigaspora rosea TaxID=44941 RepID=A0A397VTH5_9GLOM|nr:hypothetical protein C2G38_1005999 [Gigaspora rosea]
MPFGGYILDATKYNISDGLNYSYIFAYDKFDLPAILDSQGPFITNAFGVNALLYNNTFLLASPYTNDMNTSWSLLTIPLIKILAYRDHGYGNILIDQIIPSINDNVDSSTTVLNITFYDPVVLSIGSLSIYKTADNSIRQKVSATMKNSVKPIQMGKQLV